MDPDAPQPDDPQADAPLAPADAAEPPQAADAGRSQPADDPDPQPDLPGDSDPSPSSEAAGSPASAGSAPIDAAAPVDAPSSDQAAIPVPVSRTSQPVSLPTGGPRLLDAATLGRLGLAARRQKKQARLERLLAHAAAKGHVNVTDVRLLLDVPQRTAEGYLDELIASGNLARRGQTAATEYWFVR